MKTKTELSFFPMAILFIYSVIFIGAAYFRYLEGQSYSLFILFSVIGIWALVFMIRNVLVQGIRNDILYIGRYTPFFIGPRLYQALPTYDRMLISPWYWHLWTTKQWLSWLARRGHQTEVPYTV